MSDRLFPMVARILGNNTDAEDAVQEIMLKLWAKRSKLDGHPNMEGFVFLTARNYCIDVLRKKMIIVDDSFSYLNFTGSSSKSLDLEWKELNVIVLKILNSLPKMQKEVFIMRDIDDYSFKEISDALDIKIEHCRVLLSRARSQVSYELEHTYSYEKGNY